MERNMLRGRFCFQLLAMVLAALLTVWTGCSRQAPQQQPGGQPAANAPAEENANRNTAEVQPGATATPTKAVAMIPAGQAIAVRLAQPLGSKVSHPGDSFTATLAQPVEVGGKAVIPAGAEARGTVVEARPRGRFKGGALLRVRLDSVTVSGKSYDLKTAAISRTMSGKGKRTAEMIGGGAGVGAVIGAIAGGGKGAAIGAAAGAGAGTAGAGFTGNKDVYLPAESVVSFKLLEPIEVK